MRRLVTLLLVVLVIAVSVAFSLGPGWAESSMNMVAPVPAAAVSDDVRSLHAGLFVADLHADTLLWHRDLLTRGTRGHVDVPRLRDGGTAFQVFSVVTHVPSGQNYDSNTADSDRITLLAMLQRWPMNAWRGLLERALYQASRLREAAAASGGGLTLIDSQAGLESFLAHRQRERGAIGALLAMEGVNMVDGEGAIDALFDAGFRMVGLTHFVDNRVAASAHGVAGTGLTELGRTVIRRLESKGMIVDLAHVSPRTIDDVLAIATRPVVVSHTGVKGTCDHVRNLSDDHLRGVAATGGVVGIGYWEAATCGKDVEAIVRAIKHAVRVAGVEHVALGSDFDGATTTPFDATGLPLITAALLRDGFSEAEIRAIMGANVLRVLQQALPGGASRP